MKNPNPMAEGEIKYYAKAQANGVVTIDQLAEEIAYSTTLTDGDVLNTIRALVKQIKSHIREGRIVRLEALGSFQAQLSSSGAGSEEEFSPVLIRGVRLQFRPGTSIREILNPTVLNFHKVPSLKKKEGTAEEPEEEVPEV